MPSFPKDHPATHNMCRNPKHDDEGPVCCCFPNKDCYWDEIGGSSITQPLGMSGEEKKVDNITIDTLHVIADALGEEKWYEKYPYKAFECHECGNHCVDIPAIIAEAVEHERDAVYLAEHGKLRR